MKNHQTTRRDFLKTTGLTTAAIGFPTIIASSVLGRGATPPPSERIVMGGIGLGNMGGGDLGNFLNNPGVQYVAVCDVRKNVCNGAKGTVDGKYNNKDCTAYGDFRELLARPDIDAVHVATPDHWHAIMVIEACRNGKDVYCQKPETRTMREGPLMVEAARRYGRVVSGGSQRVFEDYRQVVNKCWSGELGPIKSINVEVGPLSQPCNLPPEDVPADMDWEMWLGPAAWAPYNSKRCDGNFGTGGNSWRSYLDYSGGGMTDWGAHHFGGATFAVDVRELQPTEISLEEDGGKKFLTLKYPNGVLLTHNKPGKGNLEVEGTPGEKRAPKPIPGYSVKGGIYADFLNCVKTRGRPFRDIELAVNTVAVSHLSTIAYTLGRSLKWDAAKQQFTGDEEANRYLDRARREPWQL
ncbi:MAG: Gfo/Idh/MocA family oxidoreductase [Akkermansiaceae bacterium]|nr:Gfo/Idh/MocA family oxidoreductase [Akkermansiaceae bacterium]MCF7731533.1 Gfo/Idh/MocA family oxidoreductase [Akkermansiaceae bacterium]